jgi:hypothetical protein
MLLALVLLPQSTGSQSKVPIVLGAPADFQTANFGARTERKIHSGEVMRQSAMLMLRRRVNTARLVRAALALPAAVFIWKGRTAFFTASGVESPKIMRNESRTRLCANTCSHNVFERCAPSHLL